MIELILTCATIMAGTSCTIPILTTTPMFQDEKSCFDALDRIAPRNDGLIWVCGRRWDSGYPQQIFEPKGEEK